MILDFHAHVGDSDCPGASELQRRCTPERVLAMARRAGVQKTVIFPTTYQDYRDGNRVIQQAIAAYPQELIGFARIDPQTPSAIDVLREGIEELGLRGLKMVLRGEGFSSPNLPGVMEYCADHRLPVIFCSATVVPQLTELARRHPETKVVMGHMGSHAFDCHGPRAALSAALSLENVYLEYSSALVWPIVREAAEQVPQKLLFGSDSPCIHPATEIAKIQVMDLPEEREAAILGGHAARLLGCED